MVFPSLDQWTQNHVIRKGELDIYTDDSQISNGKEAGEVIVTIVNCCTDIRLGTDLLSPRSQPMPLSCVYM